MHGCNGWRRSKADTGMKKRGRCEEEQIGMALISIGGVREIILGGCWFVSHLSPLFLTGKKKKIFITLITYLNIKGEKSKFSSCFPIPLFLFTKLLSNRLV